MSEETGGLSDVELLAAMMTFDATLPAGTVGLLPLPTRRDGRAAWAILAAELRESDDGEYIGPARRVRLVAVADGAIRDEAYAGPVGQPALASAGATELRLRLRREITIAGAAFFAGRPASMPWMRVALGLVFPGELMVAVATIVPDFLAWLADSPADRAG